MLLLLFLSQEEPSPTVTKTFTARAWIVRPAVTGSFTIDAVSVAGKSWTMAAVIKGRTQGLFDFDAYTAHTFLIGAWIHLVRTFGIDAVLRRARAGSFAVGASIGTRPNVWLMDAHVIRRVPGSFPVKSWLMAPLRVGDFDLGAFIVGTLGSFDMEARISSPATAVGSMALDAVISDTYRHANLSMAAVVQRLGTEELVPFDAVVIRVPTLSSFPVRARVAPWFAMQAYIARTFQMAASIVKPGQQIAFNAHVRGLHFGWMTFDAVVARGFIAFNAVVKASPHDIIPFIAWVRRLDQSFGINARVADRFRINAYVRPSFTIGASIASDHGQKYWPPGSGGPPGPGGPSEGGGPIDPGTGLPWLPPHHQAQIEILVDGVDMTEHVEIAQCMFEQHAGSSPGLFSLPLRGAFPKYDGGEEILVNIDGFRQFGGFVTAVTHGYHYPYVAGEDKDAEHPNQQPLTLLEGTDFNVLFDRVDIYNVPDVGSRTQGIYTTIDPLPKGLSDREYISQVLSRYMDVPWRRQFDFTTYVEETGNSPSPETPFTVETGQTLRQFFTALSQMTNAIWYMDPYYAIHSHSRANANAPRAITDGTGTDSGGDPTGGIHCRDLTVTWTIENTISDTIVYGTLAETEAGEIIFSRRQDQELIDKVGLWQYQEFRSDLHLKSHVSERAGILKGRAGRVIHRAACTIFEKGFQAGQVVSLFSGEFGVHENIPITVLTMTFAASQGADEDGKSYGIPVYQLQMSNDPEPPFNLYDALPWEFHDPATPSIDFPRFQIPHVVITDGPPPGNTVLVCTDNGWQPIWSPGDPLEPASGGARTTLPLSPPPWCIVVRTHSGPQAFAVAQSMVTADDSGYSSASQISMYVQLQFLSGWRLRVSGYGQLGTGITDSNTVSVPAPVTAGKDNFVRIQCLIDGTVRARIWSSSATEPTIWHASATPIADPDFVDPGIGGHLGMASRLRIEGDVEIAVAGDSGQGWGWFDTIQYHGADQSSGLTVYSPYLPWTWGVIKYPGGTRPAGVEEGSGGNVLDAESAPYSFPRADIYEIYPRGLFPGAFSNEHVLHRYAWGFSYVPSTISGNFDDPRMLIDAHNFIGFKPPPGAKRFHFEAFAFINVYETGAASIGSQPAPSGEGAISFEVWRSFYTGMPGAAGFIPIGGGTSPDYNYGPGEADLGHIKHLYGISYHADVSDQEMVQIGGMITIAPDALMKSHGPGPLLVNGLKRVAELKLWDVRVSFDWDPVVTDPSDALGPCVDETPLPIVETGWFLEMVEASKPGGYFTARHPVSPATLNVYHHGKLLMPDEWTQIEGSKTQFVLTSPGPRCLRLVYMTMTAGIEPDQSTSREHSRNVAADMHRLNDVRPV